jgi:hypothetical protein
MPNVEVRGRYRAFVYDGATSLDFTTYANNVSVVRRPNEISFVTLRQYIPGISTPFTTFEPGSAYVIISREGNANFDMGPYTRVDRLPSSLNVKSPQYYLGLDKNSITIPLSVYALSVNNPLSSVTGITYLNGVGVGQSTVTVDQIRNGFQTSFTHFLPNSGYQLRNRVPYTFFAPLESEMGDAYANGINTGGQYGMGYRVDNISLPGDNIYGVWDKIVSSDYSFNCVDNNQTINAPSLAALSACGTTKALFVLGNNLYGQLGTGSTKQYYATWTRVSGQWQDVYLSPYHMLAINSAGHLYACGKNDYGQLGLGSGTLSADTLTLVDNTRSYVELAAYSSCTMVRASNGFIYACGRNDTGQLCINNNTSPVYTLTQEASGLSWSSVKAHSAFGYFVAISNKKLFGSPTSNNLYWGGYVNPNYAKYTFAQENLSLPDVLETYISKNGTVIRRQNQNKLFAVGSDGGSTRRRLALLSGSTNTYYTETSVPSNANIIAPGDGIFTSINYHYIQNGKLYYKQQNSNSFIQTDINAFNIFSGIRDTPTFILSARNDLRPTPTPTVTPSPTPSPVPFIPYNTLEVSIFGSTFQLNTYTASTQSRFYNTPGNLANLFTYEKTNNNNIPPGNSINSTFDYEKTLAFNNIVGISRNSNTLQDPSGRYYAKYLWKRAGSTWTYSLLPASLDGGLSHRSIESGVESLIITPPKPNSPSSSQGIYSYVFNNMPSSSTSMSNTLNIATSYDRGATWSVTPVLKNLSNFIYGTLGDISKNKFSRTRDSNYSIELVGSTGSSSVLTTYGSTINGNTLFYVKDSNYYNVESVDTAYIYGFDFKHDYYNIPTVASIASSQIRLSRRIGNTWQTNVVLNAIPDVCRGPYYQVPSTLSFYKRAGSPVITIEFDPTNPDLVYIAYLRYSSYFNSFDSPAKINVCCYNMRTNALVFDESVVFAKYESGPYLLRSVTQYIDMPTLYFDTSNNTLNLFFFGPEFYSLGSLDYRYFKTRRLGTNSWAALTNAFTEPSTSATTYMSNSWELKTKY